MSERDRPSSGPPASRASSRLRGPHPVGVRWERLELEGLPGVADLALSFPSGLATLVRPNEWGKSSVVEGLTAVLFGSRPARGAPERSAGGEAPADGDPASGDAADAGDAGGARPQTAARPAPAPVATVPEPRRHPLGRLTFVGVDGVRYRLERDLSTDEATLARLGDEHEAASVVDGEPVSGASVDAGVEAAIGLGDRDAYEQSFCVRQPLPRAERLSGEVQRLLVGAGRGGVERALTRLEEETRRRTRRAGEPGPADGAASGELERCAAALEAVEQRLRDGREAADGAQEATRALAEAEARRGQHQGEAERLEAEAELLRRYLARWRSYQERLDAERAAAQTLTRAETLQAEAARAHTRVGRVWPELADAPEDGETRLVALISGERAVDEAARACEAAQRALDEARAAATRSSRELERFLAGAPFDDEDEGLTLMSVRELRAGADQAVADWNAYQRREGGIKEARAALRPYAMLALAPEQDRGLLRRYDYEAEARVRSVEGLENALREARADRRRALVPDAALPNDIEAEALRAALATPPRRIRRFMVQALATLGLGSAVYWFGQQIVGPSASVAMAVAVALGAATLLRPPTIAGTRLRRFQGLTRPELEELLARYDAWRAEPAPTRRDLVRLENEAEAARQQLHAFQRRMQPYQEAYPEPGAAFDAFREAQRTLLQREEVHRELCSRTFGVAPPEVPGRSPLAMPGPWPRLAAFAESRGGRARGVAELCTFLADLGGEAWEEVLATASARDGARQAFRTERERLRREVAVADTVLEEREASYTARRGDLLAAERGREEAAMPVERLLESAGVGAKELLERWHEREQAVQAAERSFDALASLLDAADCESLDALVARVERRAAEVEEERQALESLAAERDDLPGPDGSLDRPRMLDRLEALEERLTFERGARQVAEAEVFERTRELAAFHAKPTVNLARAEAERAELQARKARLELEIDALAHAHIALRAAVRDFQGSYRERLEELASAHFANLTARPGRAVRLLDDFGVEVLEPSGEELPPERLSRGAQDQLVLALRLAIADHVADDVRLPLVLDDPFPNWDAERLGQLRASLDRLARERQVVLLSHDDRFGGWGEPVRQD